MPNEMVGLYYRDIYFFIIISIIVVIIIIIFFYRDIYATQGGLATAFDLAAFRLSMIAPVKKSVNHSRTVASMRETG